MKLTMIGTGYVGLVTGTCLAESGNTVTCLDIDQQKIDNLNKGIIPIYEPGLQELLDRNAQKKRLYFTTDYASAIPGAEAVFIGVGTPPDATGKTDLSQVDAAATAIATHMTDYLVVVNKSTVPVGTGKRVKETIQNTLTTLGKDIAFDVVSNPEFLKEGNSVNDFLKPDRIVIGCDSDRAKTMMHKLYKPFILNGHPIIDMDIVSSEMTKYAANAMLATRISFMNEIANLCDKVGANANFVRKGIGSDPRIGSQFLFPGIGYGGSCFPKDVNSLIHVGAENDNTMHILEAVEAVNQAQKTQIVQKIKAYYNNNLSGKHFVVWGLSFKPRTDDIREAPALLTIDALLKEGARISAYDPVSVPNTQAKYGDQLTYMDTPYDGLEQADALLIMTEWSEFRTIDVSELKSKMATPIIFDGRNIFKVDEMTDEGIEYFGIGQGQKPL